MIEKHIPLQPFANSGDIDQKPGSAASDLGLHCCKLPFSRDFQTKYGLIPIPLYFFINILNFIVGGILPK